MTNCLSVFDHFVGMTFKVLRDQIPSRKNPFLLNSIVVIFNLIFKLSEITCENLATCFKIPEDCTSSKDCNLLVNYKHDMENSAFDVTIASNEEWGAFSQVQDLKAEKMVSIE